MSGMDDGMGAGMSEDTSHPGLRRMKPVVVALRSMLRVVALLTVTAPLAGLAAEMPFAGSCYAPMGGVKQPVEEVLFIVVDETVGFDKNFVAQVQKQVWSWLKPGRAVEVIRFSAGVRQRYAEVVTSGRLDPMPDEEWLSEIPIRVKKRLVRCIKGNRRHPGQAAYAWMAVRRALDAAFGVSDKHIAHSDIIYNIRLVADHVRQYPAKRKVVLIVSDMLENSSVTTFYHHGHVRRVSPGAEIRKVAKAGMQADFGVGVTVYVMGLGYFWAGDDGGRERYLDPKRAEQIARFWKAYFEQGHARVGEIGRPLMYGNVE